MIDLDQYQEKMANNNQAFFRAPNLAPWNFPQTFIPIQWCPPQQPTPDPGFTNGFQVEPYFYNDTSFVNVNQPQHQAQTQVNTTPHYVNNFQTYFPQHIEQPLSTTDQHIVQIDYPPVQPVIQNPIPSIVEEQQARKNEAQATIREHEELAKKALLLKKKELKWKLMQASQTQNRAQLEEIRVEANYNKRKMMKITALAHKLRVQYMKVARAAKVAESLYKKIDLQLSTQEKFVAEEKMQLTKLAVDCRKLGAQLYGRDYKLVNNSAIASEKDKQRLAMRLEAAKAVMRSKLIEFEKRASINSPAQKLLAMAKSQAQLKSSQKIELKNTITSKSPTKVSNLIEPGSPSTNESTRLKANLLKKLSPFLRKKNPIQSDAKDESVTSKEGKILLTNKQNELTPSKLSSLYDTKDSVLNNLAAYRLTKRFADSERPITEVNYTHNICPNDYICLPDLVGTCTDKNCLYQHKSNYFMSDIDKLADILSYKPSLTGFRPDPSLTVEENNNSCRLKLKQYAAKLLAKNSDKSVETIAQNLVKYVRANKSDSEILTLVRELPKVSHLACVKTLIEDSPEPEEN